MDITSSVDPREIAKFAQLADEWWDKNGQLKTLHDINHVRLQFILQYLDVKDKTALDVGCGGGILCESLATSGAIVTGIDAGADAIQAASAHAAKEALAIDYQCVSVEAFEAPSFDFVTCMEMLEHVSDPALVINHCARLLKPGGYLLLSTVNRTLQAYAAAIVGAEYVLGLLPRQTHDYNKFIKPAELAAWVREAGLEVAGIKGLSYNPFTRTASLQDSVGINYLMSCFKP